MLDQREYVGSTLYKCYRPTNDLCLLGRPSTLVQYCIKVIQMFCVYWVGPITSWANEILFKVQIIKKYHPATYQLIRTKVKLQYSGGPGLLERGRRKAYRSHTPYIKPALAQHPSPYIILGQYSSSSHV